MTQERWRARRQPDYHLTMGTDGERVSAFLADLDGEDAKLAKALGRLGDDATVHLEAVVARFDRAHSGKLDEGDRELARQILHLLHRPSPRGLELLASILAFLDCDTDRVLDHQELNLATEVLELFCKADSANDTLSNKELEVLQAVLMHLDKDGNGVLDEAERRALRDELWDPAAFLEGQKRDNPLVRELLGL